MRKPWCRCGCGGRPVQLSVLVCAVCGVPACPRFDGLCSSGGGGGRAWFLEDGWLRLWPAVGSLPALAVRVRSLRGLAWRGRPDHCDIDPSAECDGIRGCVSKQSWDRRVVQAAVLERFVHLSFASMSASAQFFTAAEVSNLHEALGSGSEECGASVLPFQKRPRAVLACGWNLALYVCGRAATSAGSLFQSRPQSRVRWLCREATHANPVSGKLMKFSDTDDVRDMSASWRQGGFRDVVGWVQSLPGRAACCFVRVIRPDCRASGWGEAGHEGVRSEPGEGAGCADGGAVAGPTASGVTLRRSEAVFGSAASGCGVDIDLSVGFLVPREGGAACAFMETLSSRARMGTGSAEGHPPPGVGRPPRGGVCLALPAARTHAWGRICSGQDGPRA